MAKSAAQHPVFARRLAQARERAGLSQTQLGVLAGLDPAVASPRINQYERGKHEPQLKTAKRLAEVLGIPPAFLYGFVAALERPDRAAAESVAEATRCHGSGSG